MLSEEEYYTALQKLHNIPSHLHGNNRQNYKQVLKKQIQEYEYNLKYGNFEPLPYIPYFVNNITTEQTLHQLIQASSSSSEFTLDTESINVYKKKNQPALIQIQVLLPYNLSLVMIVEMCHLPHHHTTRFTLIKQLFDIIFASNKTIYIWGSKDELFPFIIFNLFSREQLQSITTINLQHQFKLFWNQHHRRHHHISTSSNILEDRCICETCIGKKPSEPWSLQDSTAYLLDEYLPKILTRAQFNIGLDPNLFNLDSEEKQYRQQLTKYALNDCLSMQRILIHMKNTKFEFSFEKIIKIPYDLMESVSSSDDEIMFSQLTPSMKRLTNDQNLNINKQEQFISTSTSENSNWKITSTNNSRSANQRHTQSTSEREHRYTHETQPVDEHKPEHKPQQLSMEERKRIHNRSCTLKQRKRLYRQEIVCENTDARFTTTKIKKLLRERNIEFSAINRSQSKLNKRTLYIGIKNINHMPRYEILTKYLLSTANYNRYSSDRHHRSNSRY
ncbi:unnamed protein product [Rotaria socialis]|uniref:Uncharacterized protein n=5 Tax=Rotaria socialis TaxID=392032 RepID=A0A818IFD4_9BILA|nr:unnamed protein product [Rotaria socialis]CAF4473110.1 unnamed protein product [Rotaria socialis]